jgi:hypothetical protein
VISFRAHARQRELLGVAPLIDGRDLLNPAAALRMLQMQNRLGRPVEMISNEGYLLIDGFERVA